ncbi:hypothetical protein [Idiomarina seosinensis]|nr:hypothetical protein [Idiomarina seosinensis]
MRREEKRTVFGITLSKRGWNNVLVYAVLLLMVLLWFSAPSSERTFKEDAGDNAVMLLPNSSVLDSILIDDQTIEKTDAGWRCAAPCSLSAQQANALASSWQNLKIKATDRQPENKLVDVYLNFADNQHARLELFLEPQLLLRLPQQDKVFEPVGVTIEQLVGR